MGEESKTERSKEVFSTLCEVLEEDIHEYDAEEELLFAHYTKTDKTGPMLFLFSVDEQVEAVTLTVTLPWQFEKTRQLDGAIVALVATVRLANNYFDYDMENDRLSLRSAAIYRGNNSIKNQIRHMMESSYAVCHFLNGRLQKITDGRMSVEEFITDFDHIE